VIKPLLAASCHPSPHPEIQGSAASMNIATTCAQVCEDYSVLWESPHETPTFLLLSV
jgi:hypothetical protein